MKGSTPLKPSDRSRGHVTLSMRAIEAKVQKVASLGAPVRRSQRDAAIHALEALPVYDDVKASA